MRLSMVHFVAEGLTKNVTKWIFSKRHFSKARLMKELQNIFPILANKSSRLKAFSKPIKRLLSHHIDKFCHLWRRFNLPIWIIGKLVGNLTDTKLFARSCDERKSV